MRRHDAHAILIIGLLGWVIPGACGWVNRRQGSNPADCEGKSDLSYLDDEGSEIWDMDVVFTEEPELLGIETSKVAHINIG